MAKIVLNIVTDSKSAKEDIDGLKSSLGDLGKSHEKASNQSKNYQKQTKDTSDAIKKQSQSIATMIPNIMKWQVAMTAVMLPLRKMQEALESVNETLVETEKRVISLRRVAGDSANANELYKLAQQYGQTFENVAEVVELLVKSGYEWGEAMKAAEPALLAINVAELDATQATEGLIAVVKQYGMELEDLNYIQGVLNKTADNAAVTTEKLLLALQKTGSTADNANISFEETVGLITALSEGTAASGQNIGNALRSLIVFTKDDKALQTFASLSENMKSLVDDYKTGGGSIVDVWRGLGTELQKLENSGQTLRDIFGGTDLDSDIAAKLTEVEDQIAEVYGTAGNYRQNYFIALLENLSTVEKVTNNLNDANTYSQKENLTYLDSYEAKANKLQAKWQEIANDEQGWLKFKKDLVEAANGALLLLEAFGGLDTAIKQLAITGAALLVWFKPAFFAGILTALKNLVGYIPTAIKWWTGYAQGVYKLNSALRASIPVLGMVLVAITAVTGAISANNQKIEEQRRQTVQHWESIKKETAELSVLIEKYETLDSASKEYSEVEKSLLSILGDKVILLDDLKKGTEEYRQALLDLSQTELEKRLQDQENAKTEAETLLQNSGIGKTKVLAGTSGFLSDFGINTYKALPSFLGGDIWNYLLEPSNTVEGNVANYQKLMKAREEIQKFYVANKDDSEFKDEFLKKYGMSFDLIPNLLTTISSEISRAEGFINSYNSANTNIADLKKQIAEISGTGSSGNGTDFETLLNNAKNLVNLRKSELKLLEAQGASEDKIKEKKDQIFDALSKQIGLLIDQGGNEIEINNLIAERVNLLEETKGQYDDIVSALEKARDLQKDSYEFEEKKKAVLEAEKALEEAQKNRLVQVYNAETGRFEFVANQKDIQNAKDDLDKARKDVENSAWNEVIEILKSEDGNLTKAKEILEKWSGAYGTGSASFQNDIEEILYGSAFKTVQDFVTSHGIFASGASEPLETFIGMPGYEDLTDAFNALPDEWKKKITDKTGAKLYDHGGILHGLGGIKATTRPETVLDPEMTAKILEPTSNAQFASFARSMGLLFGASKSLASPSSPMIQRSISSDRHDRHYTVNGVPVTTQMAEQYTIKELFELMPLV